MCNIDLQFIYSCISMFIGGQQQTEQAILSLLKSYHEIEGGRVFQILV